MFEKNNLKHYRDITNSYKDIIVSFLSNEDKTRVKFTNRTLEEIVPEQISDEPERVQVILS